MSARIDHAAQAKQFLPAQGDAMHAGRIAVAQVHATLALVEQQRIANLIAVATWNDQSLASYLARRADGAEVDYDAERARVDAIFVTVREELGL
jgi:aminoglycoside phosphotransferase